MELKYFNDGEIFYANGKLKEEPEESLEELIKQHDELCKEYSNMVRKKKDAEKPYIKRRWIHNNKPHFIEDPKYNYGHRTWQNAEWSEITLAFAADFTSPGEITTAKAAGDKLVKVDIPVDVKKYRQAFYGTAEYEEKKKIVEGIYSAITTNPHYKESGIKLNIAGNGLKAYKTAGVNPDDAEFFVIDIIFSLKVIKALKISEIRSGGQSGADEWGIKAGQMHDLRCSILAPKGYRFRDENGEEHEGFEEFSARFKEEYVDYEEWEQKDSESCMAYGFAEFNGFNAIDMLEYDIDLKIMHINEREKQNNK